MMPDRDGAAWDGIVRYGTTEDDTPPARGTGEHGGAKHGGAKHGRAGRGAARHERTRHWHGRAGRDRTAHRGGGRRQRGAHEAGQFSEPWSAGTPRPRRLRWYGNGVLALTVSCALLAVLGAGFGQVPALGPALVPGHGVWTSAASAKLPASGALTLPGLRSPVQVSFSQQGVPAISARSDTDAFLALGYLHASFRLTQLDIERRLAEGTLARLDGPSAVASDSFELRLGLLRTARAEWAGMARSSPAAQALIAYSRGINDYLAQLRVSRQWPAVFSLAGVYPADWTPVDSLAVQGALAQQLGFSTRPLDDALLARSLGAHAATWFGIQPPTPQHPYDQGPYRYLGLSPLPGAGANGGTAAGPRSAGHDQGSPATIPAGLAQSSAAILAQATALPPGQVPAVPGGDAWAANGPKVAGGGAMLAGDPHLAQTLPSGWYQVALSAPGLAVSGVSVPGLPAVLIGHNAHIAWALTSAQSQTTLYYDEQTSAARPGQYFWHGRWRRMRALHYTIGVRGGPSRPLTVEVTVHGPVLAQVGRTVAVDWMGALGSPDVSALLAVGQADDFSQFKAALAGWRSPALTFVYADDRGNIGAISAGLIPQVRSGSPWLPMPGGGPDDVAGVIPYAAVPQVYDPPSHLLAAAGQRPVSASYPYYLGTASFFDPGYRADAAVAYLGKHWSMGRASFASLQTDVGDRLAAVIVPELLTAVRGSRLTTVQQQAVHVLASWDKQMAVDSAGASIWWTFWSRYLATVFGPWWTAAKVPVQVDSSGLAAGPNQVSLDEDLQAWTLGSRADTALRASGSTPRTAATIMRAAFAATVAELAQRLGGGPGSWTWGKLHTTEYPSLTGVAALGYGPRPAGGDIWTIDAAGGGLSSESGADWRMVAGWSGTGKPVAEGIYPGGQSENPGSPWYSNLIGYWRAGHDLPLPAAGLVTVARAGSVSPGTAGPPGGPATSVARIWELRP